MVLLVSVVVASSVGGGGMAFVMDLIFLVFFGQPWRQFCLILLKVESLP